MTEENKTIVPPASGDGPQATTTAIKPADRLQTFRDLLQKYRPNFAAVLPQTFKVEKLIQVALAAIGRTPKLALCTPASVLRSLMIAAQLGLDPSGVLGSGYLVPFWNTKLSRYEAQFIAGYRGLIDLARRSGEVTNVEAHVVYGKDQFEYRLGLDPILNHVPVLDPDPGSPRCAYVVIRLKDSPVPLVEIMSHTQIEEIRKRSRAGNEGPWVDNWHEMARKTVTRRGLKYAPLSVEAAHALAIEDRAEAGEDVSDLVELPLIEEGEGEGASERPATKSGRLAEQLKTAEEKAKAALETQVGAVETGTPVLPTVPVPTPVPEPAGPGPGWPKIITYEDQTFTLAAPAELEAFQAQCKHPAQTVEGECLRCGKNVRNLTLTPPEKPTRRSAR